MIHFVLGFLVGAMSVGIMHLYLTEGLRNSLLELGKEKARWERAYQQAERRQRG
ncbi:MAG: hypothetical protein ACLFMQ_01695 [Desulfohalobiaceae bacterium]